jgi:hypothetical protein
MTGRFLTGASCCERRNWLAAVRRRVSAAPPLAGRSRTSSKQPSSTTVDAPAVPYVRSIEPAGHRAFVVGASALRMNPIRSTLDARNARHHASSSRLRTRSRTLRRCGTREQWHSTPFAAWFAEPSYPEQDSALPASPIERVFRPVDSSCQIEYNRAGLSQCIERLYGDGRTSHEPTSHRYR